jgi:hypothetical protein
VVADVEDVEAAVRGEGDGAVAVPVAALQDELAVAFSSAAPGLDELAVRGEDREPVVACVGDQELTLGVEGHGPREVQAVCAARRMPDVFDRRTGSCRGTCRLCRCHGRDDCRSDA